MTGHILITLANVQPEKYTLVPQPTKKAKRAILKYFKLEECETLWGKPSQAVAYVCMFMMQQCICDSRSTSLVQLHDLLLHCS